MNPVTVKTVEYIAHRLAKELYTFNEPIPDFSTRYPNVLEGCLGAPFLEFSEGSPYPSLVDKASILFYLMNKKWLEVEHEKLYEFSKLVAGSDAKLKDSIVQLIKQFISNNMVDLPNQNLEETK